MDEFNDKMALLQAEGYDEKKLLNAKKESNKLKDLTFLKGQTPPGPFSTVQEVDHYLNLSIEEKAKNHRFYVEVRYARVTSTTMKETAKVFQLKRSGKNLTTIEYAENLKKHFDDSESVSTLTLDDLNSVLTTIAQKNNEVEEPVLEVQIEQSTTIENTSIGTPEQIQPDKLLIEIDDPIAAVWLADDSNVYEWHLGFVSQVSKDSIEVRYFIKASKDCTRWNAPEDESVHTTNLNQILCKLNDIGYLNGNVIRCTIAKEQLRNIRAKFEYFLSKNNFS